MAEVTSESPVMAQQVSSLSELQPQPQAVVEGGGGGTVPVREWLPIPEPREEQLLAMPSVGAAACHGLCGASLCNSASMHVQRALWCEDRRGCEPG